MTKLYTQEEIDALIAAAAPIARTAIRAELLEEVRAELARALPGRDQAVRQATADAISAKLRGERIVSVEVPE